MTKTAVFKAMVPRSHGPCSADMGGTLVTAASVAQARRRDVAAEIGGAFGARALVRSTLPGTPSTVAAREATPVPADPRAALRMPMRGVAATSDAAIRMDTARSLTSAVRSAGENAGRGTRMSTLQWRPHSQALHRHRWRHRHKRKGEADARAAAPDGDGDVKREHGRSRGSHRDACHCCGASVRRRSGAPARTRRGGRAGRVCGWSASGAGADAPSRDARGGTAKKGEPIATEAATGSYWTGSAIVMRRAEPA